MREQSRVFVREPATCARAACSLFTCSALRPFGCDDDESWPRHVTDTEGLLRSSVFESSMHAFEARELKRAPSRHASVYYDRVPACEAQAIMAEGEAASAPEGEAPVPCLQARLRPMFKAMRGSPTPATRTMKV